MKYISHSLKLKTCIETLDICLFFPTTNLFLHLSEALLEGKKKKKYLDKLERHSYTPESIQLWEGEKRSQEKLKTDSL